jgi:hypothetical protein
LNRIDPLGVFGRRSWPVDRSSFDLRSVHGLALP